jgi:AcrR family transcriptional regulator
LAKVLKTNARMLVYHFGSREGLMRQILTGLRERENARIEAWFHAGGKPRTLPQFLRWYWKRLSAPRVRPGIRLIFELYALALQNPHEYPGVLEGPVAYWQKLTEKAGIPAKADDVEATLLLAATRGLLLDLCATGDRVRVGRALEAFAQFVEWRAASAK